MHTRQQQNSGIAYPGKSRYSNPYVGIDCLSLPANFSGAAYYIYHLTRELLCQARTFPLAIFSTPEHARLFAPFLQPGDKIVTVPIRNRAEKLYFYEYKLRSYLLRERVSLFYATHYICPPPHPDYKLITTFHDMGFILYPQFYPLIKRMYFRLRLKTFLLRSTHIVAVSRSTADSIRQCYPDFPAERISVIYPGTDHVLISESKSPLPLHPPPPYLLAVNSLEKRKNIPFLIRLFNHLKAAYRLPHQLLLVGTPSNGYRQIRNEISQSPYRNDIVYSGYLPEAYLNFYYRKSDFFVNTSQYEGFGFTPFEAIQHNCPAFLYQNNTVEEIIGEHSYVFDTFSVTEWADTIYREYQDNFRNRIHKKEISHLTWEKSARQTIRLFQHLLTS